jgi:hypothetical protein
MIKLVSLTALLTIASFNISASTNVPISGVVESKCVITTDTTGVYGNPTPNILSTAAADGGVEPVIRYDIISADHYKAKITYPNDFSDNPTLDDVVNWDGDVSVGEVSVAGMSIFETNKIEYNNTVEFELTIAGSVWFDVESEADYGYDKSLPAGNYSAIVEAECVAI